MMLAERGLWLLGCEVAVRRHRVDHRPCAFHERGPCSIHRRISWGNSDVEVHEAAHIHIRGGPLVIHQSPPCSTLAGWLGVLSLGLH
jgi:hypothetical protein